MDLKGNPTSEMGHEMCRLAAFDDVQHATSGAELAARLAAGQLPPDLMSVYRAFMDRFGCRGMREIDIAAPRPYEDPAGFFDRLKQIHTDRNATMDVEQ